jgi:8-oxo-dGTP pyrophosphatase MutT (NUDIX family)
MMWKKLSSKVLYEHPRLTLVEDEVEMENGITGKYLKFDDKRFCVATIICVGSDGKILVQKQLSYPYNKEIFQFPGGGVDKGEDPEVGVNRELSEESKLKAQSLKFIGKHLINNRRSTLMNYVYVGTDLVEAFSNAEPEEEEIKNIWMTESEIDDLIRKDEDIEVNMLASWTFYKLKK